MGLYSVYSQHMHNLWVGWVGHVSVFFSQGRYCPHHFLKHLMAWMYLIQKTHL